MYVHAGTVVANERLGHESRRLAIRVRDIVYAVLQDLNFVSLSDQCVEPDTDFTLTCCTHFVMVYFYIETYLLHR